MRQANDSYSFSTVALLIVILTIQTKARECLMSEVFKCAVLNLLLILIFFCDLWNILQSNY